jgi:hypothetical protein
MRCSMISPLMPFATPRVVVKTVALARKAKPRRGGFDILRIRLAATQAEARKP